jgi:hypothetical protein
MRHETKLSTVNQDNVVSSPTRDGADEAITTHYLKMKKAQYNEYLAAHEDWVEQVHTVDTRLHDEALRRRFTSKMKEKLVLQDFDEGVSLANYGRKIELNGVYRDADSAKEQLYIMTEPEKKTEHPPTLSTAPHQAAKRANKKKVRNSRNMAKANFYEAKAEVIQDTTGIPDTKDRLLKVTQLQLGKPLHKAELSAARDAAARSRVIQFGSADLVANIEPEQGWKVVTRKKGATRVCVEEITRTGPNNQAIDRVTTFRDTAAGKFSALAAVRNPTAVVNK